MHLSGRLFSLSILFLSLALLNPYQLLAVDDEAHIIALSNNNIYFVSPSSGEARLIVERNPEKDALLADMDAGAGLELSTIAPDNTKFAYTTPLYEVLDPKFEDRRRELASLLPRELFVVDIASGKQTHITDYGANFTEMVENDKVTNISHLTWSDDAQRLYFLSSVLSTRNRVSQKTIEYYDLMSGERQTLVKLSPQVQVAALYGIHQNGSTHGLVLVERSPDERTYKFIFYGSDGNIINSSELTLPGAQDCPNGLMFDMNPVYYYVDYHYAYYVFEDTYNKITPTLWHFESGDSTSIPVTLLPAIVSRANADIPLAFDGACNYDASDRWTLTDAWSESIVMSVFPGIDHPSQIAFSPDGTSIAMLNGETLRIIDINSETLRLEERGYTPTSLLKENVIRELDFSATRILWGAMDFTLAPLVYRD